MHTRIDETIAKVVDKAHAGNLYVNRNMVGAVVGVQPFGGEGLSGTGPKAGGPLYMYRLLATRPVDAVSRTFKRMDEQAADAHLRNSLEQRLGKPLDALKEWAGKEGKAELASLCDSFAELSQSGLTRTLPGPTGERNTYMLLPAPTCWAWPTTKATC